MIRDRIETINDSLKGIDYNEGRYIRLVPDQTPNIEVREFRAELRACTDNVVGAATRRSVFGGEVPPGEEDHRAVQGSRGNC